MYHVEPINGVKQILDRNVAKSMWAPLFTIYN